MADRTDPGCKKILDQLRKADVLLVCKLDELSPSLRHVIAIIEKLGRGQDCVSQS